MLRLKEAMNIKLFKSTQQKRQKKYGNYTSWCVTHGKGHYNSYATRGNRFYFCLRKGFESIQATPTEGCPLDEYGLSMIAVLIDMDGEPVHITTRWNHDYDGEDNENLKNVEQFEAITHIDWYNNFIPYSREELKAMGITPFDEVPELLTQGADPKRLFDDVRDFSEGFGKIKLNNKYNFISKENTLLSPYKWFDVAWTFSEGFGKIKLNDKGWNYIDTKGKLLSKLWFDLCGEFSEGFAEVELDGNPYYIDTKGNFYDYNNREPIRSLKKNKTNSRRVYINENQLPLLFNIIHKKVK